MSLIKNTECIWPCMRYLLNQNWPFPSGLSSCCFRRRSRSRRRMVERSSSGCSRTHGGTEWDGALAQRFYLARRRSLSLSLSLFPEGRVRRSRRYHNGNRARRRRSIQRARGVGEDLFGNELSDLIWTDLNEVVACAASGMWVKCNCYCWRSLYNVTWEYSYDVRGHIIHHTTT